MFAERQQEVRSKNLDRHIALMKAAIGSKEKYNADKRGKEAISRRATMGLVAGNPDLDSRTSDRSDCAKRKQRKRIMFATGKAGKTHNTTKPYKPPGGKC